MNSTNKRYKTHILGFPRIGAKRELKFALEKYWQNKLSIAELEDVASNIRQQAWQWQKDAELDYITVGDFSFYDHILDFSIAIGNIPQRYQDILAANGQGLNDYFETMSLLARGKTVSALEAQACELTKWYDTNYHYIVPEFAPKQNYQLSLSYLLEQVKQAKSYGAVKVVLPGIISYVWLGKEKEQLQDRLSQIEKLLPIYQQILDELQEAGVSCIQFDESVLVNDLSEEWRSEFKSIYQRLNFHGIKNLLAIYFSTPQIALDELFATPFESYHLDFVHSNLNLKTVLQHLPANKQLSIGILNGRNIWKADLDQILAKIKASNPEHKQAWLSTSCSLLHVPYDVALEDRSEKVFNWLSFAKQKLLELQHIALALNGEELSQSSKDYLEANRQAIEERSSSPHVHKQHIKQQLKDIDASYFKRQSDFSERRKVQQERLNLPIIPTTTIGSFPQTNEIRQKRKEHRLGNISKDDYVGFLKQEIKNAIVIQEEIGLDVLVHGEAERNDMVEYFGEQLEGFIFSSYGWVQSYGSRCVKPPIIYGDIERTSAMTVDWTKYAQSLSSKPVKGMLTGPVTILQWSFVRDDQPRELTCKQIALAILAEVQDLEKNGTAVIQVDEPALREGLPLDSKQQEGYLKWATDSFKLATSKVDDATQIHTHMCYCEFNDVILHIVSLDADVISIETSRSQMELLDVFKAHGYPNAIGPGVYDIHSPRVPEVSEMVDLLAKAGKFINKEQLWINPDCGLKTRAWQETKQALQNMVEAAKQYRSNA